MCRIVIAEDEPLIKMDIKEILEENSYTVVGEASTGFDAVEICKKHKPDLVIMDIKMEIMDGITAAGIMKKENIAGCVLLLTAFSDREMIKKAKDADVVGYLVKPVDESSLIPAIEIALHNQNKYNELNIENKKSKDALVERKLIERAKGILMETKGMTEMSAYQYLRKVAMDRECTMAKISEAIIMSNP